MRTDCSGLVYDERHHKSSASRVRDGLAEDEADNLDGNYAGMRARSECSICETRSATFCERRLLIVPPASSGAYTDGDTKRQGVVEYAVAYDDAQNGGYRSQKTRVTHLASGMNVVERTRTRMWDPTGGRDDADLDVCRKLVRLCSGQLVLDAVIRNRDFVSYHNRLDVLNDMPATREPHIPKLHYSDPRQVAALVRNDPGRDDPHIFLCPSYVKFALRDLAVFSKALPMLLPPLPPQPPCLAPLASDGAVTGGPQDLESGRSGARENKRDDRHDVACDGALHEGWTGYDTRVAFGRIYDVDARGRVRERVAEGARGGDRYYDTLRIWAAVVSELGRVCTRMCWARWKCMRNGATSCTAPPTSAAATAKSLRFLDRQRRNGRPSSSVRTHRGRCTSAPSAPKRGCAVQTEVNAPTRSVCRR